jgi:hypothetical protein
MSLIKSLVDVGAGSRVVLMASAQSSSIDDEVRLVSKVDHVDASVGTDAAVVVVKAKSAGTVVPPEVCLFTH